jgi:hypothetical protein
VGWAWGTRSGPEDLFAGVGKADFVSEWMGHDGHVGKPGEAVGAILRSLRRAGSGTRVLFGVAPMVLQFSFIKAWICFGVSVLDIRSREASVAAHG